MAVERAGHPVLDDVTLDIPLGRLTIVVGHSGAGKSILLALLAGAVSPDRGTVVRHLAESGVTYRDQHWRSRRGSERADEVLELAAGPGEALLLDEPERGIDGASADRVHEHLAFQVHRGATVVVATHDYSWARAAEAATILVDHGHCHVVHVRDIDFLALQNVTLERLRGHRER